MKSGRWKMCSPMSGKCVRPQKKLRVGLGPPRGWDLGRGIERRSSREGLPKGRLSITWQGTLAAAPSPWVGGCLQHPFGRADLRTRDASQVVPRSPAVSSANIPIGPQHGLKEQAQTSRFGPRRANASPLCDSVSSSIKRCLTVY